jgi:hypothetical protein
MSRRKHDAGARPSYIRRRMDWANAFELVPSQRYARDSPSKGAPGRQDFLGDGHVGAPIHLSEPLGEVAAGFLHDRRRRASAKFRAIGPLGASSDDGRLRCKPGVTAGPSGRPSCETCHRVRWARSTVLWPTISECFVHKPTLPHRACRKAAIRATTPAMPSSSGIPTMP